MNEQKDRLKTILSDFKGNQKEFGETIGKSKQTISGWMSGRFPIPEDAAITIEMVHGYRREWILTGDLPSKISYQGYREKIADIDAESNLLRKIRSNKKLKDLVEVLAALPKKDFEIANKLILSLAKEDSKENTLP
ncbi:transcriptional regulator [Leptospira kmetyi]|uniref:Helix-turn-helix domain-containing protein n=1 Tax=Leptospira kmetyi TaxID=408139 RepID=A0A2M9XSW2_9LEPT|nr:helix-turn-helix domain-containing protein [Leptospira kmetyi]AYV57559.1 helix-turn-helix domain-containing protein [Leptospira kmetyi]PJZ42276.1 transcriptional regulator [Leptospira kmetyi]TGK23252.1 helix-turn-helix domain-containing protein [Leptospira kmetyi]TGK28850.1 helix-turn-helix domain-containing protein [Leptospira kmetyi]